MPEFRSIVRAGVGHALAANSVTVLRLALGAAAIWFTAVRIGHADQRWEAILIGTACVGGMILLRRGAAALRIWIDRRFFREAYDAEKILSELSTRVGSIRDRKLLLETIGREVEAALHPLSFTALVEHEGGYTMAHTSGVGISEPATIGGNSGLARLLRSQRGPLKLDWKDPQSWGYGLSELDSSLLRALGTCAVIPIAADSRLLGMLSLGARRSGQGYSRADLRLLSAVASQAGLAIENVRLVDAVRRETAQRERLVRELEIAREVQERLFPQVLPHVEGLDFGGYCRPAQGVGGDYYDFIRLDDGALGIAIGDVSGKGIAAALLMASLQASLRAQMLVQRDTLSQMLQNVNRLVYGSSSENRYATFFYAQYAPRERVLQYVNAGHNPPIVVRVGTNEIVRLDAGGTVLGLFPHTVYSEGQLQLVPGDIFVAFTDGISEAENEAEEEFGESRLIPAIQNAHSRSAADLITSILAEVDTFTAGAPQHDDMTLITVRTC